MDLSVFIITYNHREYIHQTLDSVLAQKVNFSYEIVIGDDCSTDGTSEIIREYEEKYPDKIRYFRQEKNLGQNGLKITVETLKQVRGKYIATLDGDDYWIDENKLQVQFDFMQNNPTLIGCFHNAEIHYFNSDKIDLVNSPEQKTEISLDDLIGEKEVWFMATSSVVYKTREFLEFPEWFLASVSGDIPKYILLAKKGNFGYIPQTMSVYRKHLRGTSFSDNYFDEKFLRNRIAMYEGIDQELNFQYHERIRITLAGYYRQILDSKQYENKTLRAYKIWKKYIELKQCSKREARDLLRDYVIPKWIMKIYSFFTLLKYRF